MKKKRRRLKRTVIAKFIILLGLIGIIYSGYNIVKWSINVNDNAKIKDNISKNIQIIKNNDIDEYNVNFDNLKEINSDTIAYLKVNGTNIDYIVVKGENNSYYLNHNFNKKYNKAGWVFADYHNKFDETDKNIVIYGHNTRDGSMFETLKNVLNEEWYKNEDNYKIVLVTENDTYFYRVFSTYSIVPEDYYINTIFNTSEDFLNFIQEIKSRSIYDYGVEVDFSDKVLTLSSCIGDGKKRVVLHAKLID